jgi:hypothetical protein
MAFILSGISTHVPARDHLLSGLGHGLGPRLRLGLKLYL